MTDMTEQQYEINVDPKPSPSMSQFLSLLAKHKEVMIERSENVGWAIVGEDTNVALERASLEPIAPAWFDNNQVLLQHHMSPENVVASIGTQEDHLEALRVVIMELSEG
jgi:hypothetical protein